MNLLATEQSRKQTLISCRKADKRAESPAKA